MTLKTTFRGIFYLQKFNYTVAKGKDRGLRSIAALIRGACIRTLRVSQRTSAPGHPPFAKTRGGLRVIEFTVYRNGAIIGPVKFPGSNFFNEPVPHIHEFGGTYFSHSKYFQYPQRSFMNHTLKQLIARGKIPREFSVSMARQFN